MDQAGASPPETSADATDISTDEVVNDSGSSGTPTSSTVPPPQPPTQSQAADTLGLKESVEQLSPSALMTSIQDQFLGGKTQEQLQKEQADVAASAQSAQLSRQAFEQAQAQDRMHKQQIVTETVQLKDQAQQMGGYEKSSAVLSQTTAADLSEQTIVRTAMADAQLRRAREQRARQLMAQQQATRKGPQAEGGQAKSSMVSQMMGGAEAGSAAQDPDALQRQAEQAMGE